MDFFTEQFEGEDDCDCEFGEVKDALLEDLEKSSHASPQDHDDNVQCQAPPKKVKKTLGSLTSMRKMLEQSCSLQSPRSRLAQEIDYRKIPTVEGDDDPLLDDSMASLGICDDDQHELGEKEEGENEDSEEDISDEDKDENMNEDGHENKDEGENENDDEDEIKDEDEEEDENDDDENMNGDEERHLLDLLVNSMGKDQVRGQFQEGSGGRFKKKELGQLSWRGIIHHLYETNRTIVCKCDGKKPKPTKKAPAHKNIALSENQSQTRLVFSNNINAIGDDEAMFLL
ncbi:39 kDa FK506-binding nuclear protein-like [Dendronephthya gigantea]|uniref:39 kDa FK506-binding nuclear protein-like n=1 Tax=Dendronephthya gigantea TaxID=151771 RepID=UPI00106C2EE1|nr:39 kDa FK506-binding nuclear protein-like [Dendronephthya gigantea]